MRRYSSDESSLSPANRLVEHENTFPDDDPLDSPLPVNERYDLTHDCPEDSGEPISPFGGETLDATQQENFPIARQALKSRGRARAVSAIGREKAPAVASSGLEDVEEKEDQMDGDRFLESLDRESPRATAQPSKNDSDASQSHNDPSKEPLHTVLAKQFKATWVSYLLNCQVGSLTETYPNYRPEQFLEALQYVLHEFVEAASANGAVNVHRLPPDNNVVCREFFDRGAEISMDGMNDWVNRLSTDRGMLLELIDTHGLDEAFTGIQEKCLDLQDQMLDVGLVAPTLFSPEQISSCKTKERFETKAVVSPSNQSKTGNESSMQCTSSSSARSPADDQPPALVQTAGKGFDFYSYSVNTSSGTYGSRNTGYGWRGPVQPRTAGGWRIS